MAGIGISDRDMRPTLFSTLLLALSIACSVSCTDLSFSDDPKPDPLKLAPPAAPAARPGEIRVFGHQLSTEGADAIRVKLHETEGAIIAAYEKTLELDPHSAGLMQLRLEINAKGEIAGIKPIEMDLNNDEIGKEVDAILRKVAFPSGSEAYVFYTMEFLPRPFEVLGVKPDFDGDHPTLIVDVLNRTAFHLRDVAVTVRVQSPEKALPLRVSRVRLRAPFEPRGRRTLRVPIKNEWATERYTFLVDARPSTKQNKKKEE